MFRFRYKGQLWDMLWLPFGWKHLRVIGQFLSGRLVEDLIPTFLHTQFATHAVGRHKFRVLWMLRHASKPPTGQSWIASAAIDSADIFEYDK